jgi:hypothetical protein
MASDLARFGLTEMLRTSRAVHQRARSALTMESCARQICRALYDELVAADGSRACALVRCYKTHDYGELPLELQAFARRMLESVQPPPATMKCLTLLGSSGEQPSWNSRRSSRGHQAIPLPSAQMVERAPMIARLIKDFGLELADVLNPSPETVRNLAGRTYEVFHVPEARGSDSIPAQDDFVLRHGVRSAVGFGGSLASGDLYAVILFSRVPVDLEAAKRFRTIALDVKTLFFGFSDAQIFDPISISPEERERPLHP